MQAVDRLAKEPEVMTRELVEFEAAVHRSACELEVLNEAPGTKA